MLMNEKIKVSEVELFGLDGENLGIVPTKQALEKAKELKVDLVCLSLTSSPPPCRLVPGTEFKQKMDQEKRINRKSEKGPKMKEIRLTAHIEDHDYDTKKRQAEKILVSGDMVQITVRLERKESEMAVQLAKRLVTDLAHCAKQQKGIQTSGKQVVVVLVPLS